MDRNSLKLEYTRELNKVRKKLKKNNWFNLILSFYSGHSIIIIKRFIYDYTQDHFLEVSRFNMAVTLVTSRAYTNPSYLSFCWDFIFFISNYFCRVNLVFSTYKSFFRVSRSTNIFSCSYFSLSMLEELSFRSYIIFSVCYWMSSILRF